MKKFITLILVTLAFIATVNAQEKNNEVKPYALEHHQKRLEIFNSEPIVKNKIIFLGDSIIEFGDWAKLLNDSSVINRGIAGDNTFGVLNRLQDIINRQPSKLFIHIGINDISQNTPDKIIVANILSIVKKVRKDSPATLIYVSSILPTNDSVKTEYPDAYNKNGRVVKVNNQLKRNKKMLGFVYVDLYKKFHDADGKLLEKYADSDGLHLNSTGYQIWIDFLTNGNHL